MRIVLVALACLALHDARPVAHEREHDSPLSTYREGAAELAVKNRVALAESLKLRARPRGPTVPGTTWVSLGPSDGDEQRPRTSPADPGRH
jgi:hypothetical protein